jgi:peptide/nickel transport system substrate-binding protein
VEFRLLGPVQAREGASEVALGGPKLRALLATLLLSANEVLSRDHLIDALWGERPPATAAHTLDDYVSRLRRALGGERIETRAPGYRLRVDPGELDVDRFEALLRQGRDALARDDPATALERLDVALALWHGRALADLLHEPIGQAEAGRLEERRRLAVEERHDAALRLGRHAEVVSDLERLVEHEPYRERSIAQLMLALYRSGRHAEALAVLRTARQRFAAELGLEPGPSLRELEQQILNHDERLSVAGTHRTHRRRRRPRVPRSAVAIGAGLLALAGGAVVASNLRDPEASSGSPAPDRLLGFAGSLGEGTTTVPLGGAPTAMAADGNSLWLADANAGTVARTDLGSGAVAQILTVGGTPGAMAVGGGSIWVADAPGATVTRIDRTTQSVTQTIRLDGARVSALGFGDGSVWVADAGHDRLVDIDASSGEIRRTISLDVSPSALAVHAGAIWIADYDAHAVIELDAASGRPLTRVNVGQGPAALAVQPDAVWIANTVDSTVTRIDPARGVVVATIAVDSGPIALSAGEGRVWVASQHAGTLSEIDAGRGAVVRSVRLGATPTALVALDGRPWVGVRARPARRGGRLVLLRQRPLRIDPAVSGFNSPFQSTGLVHDGLVTFNHVGGPSGSQIVPDLAVALPIPTDGGTTYAFRLRRGIRYSDGRPLRAADFRRGVERSFVLRASDRDLFAGIEGAGACLAPSASTCNLGRGIATDERERTVTFHLLDPDPQFLVKLTNGGFAMPVPGGTPMRRTGFVPIPGTGPYKVASADRDHIRYVRNGRFREWSHAAQPAGEPDEIVWRFGLTPVQQVREIESGRADWMADPVPGKLLPSLRVRRAAQVHSYPRPDTEWLQINARQPPFDDLRVRRALNLAIDREALAAIQGGPDTATPTCQLLPPGLAGYRRYCPYTQDVSADGTWTAPDLARARRLVAASGTRGMLVTVWGWTDDPYFPHATTQRIAATLRRLGYRTRIRSVSHDFLDDAPARVFADMTVIPVGWLDFSAYGFFAPWLSCRGAHAHGWFCDPRIDRDMRRASAVEAIQPRRAARLWAQIDHELVDRAPFVPLYNLRETDFVSRRVHNFQHHPYLGAIVDQIRVR